MCFELPSNISTMTTPACQRACSAVKERKGNLTGGKKLFYYFLFPTNINQHAILLYSMYSKCYDYWTLASLNAGVYILPNKEHIYVWGQKIRDFQKNVKSREMGK